MTESITWPAIAPAERVTVLFDFGTDLQPGDSIVAVTMNAWTVSGVDESGSAVLIGSPQIKGRRVFHRAGARPAGCAYRIECTATSAFGDVYFMARVLPVSNKVY